MSEETSRDPSMPTPPQTGKVAAQQPPPEAAPPPTTQTQAPAPKPIQRRYKENMTFFSDLFKLKVAKMLQFKGWTKISQDAPRDEKGDLNDDWFYTEHCHYFHTRDSNGKEQTYSQPVGQHVHKMEIVRNPNDPDEIFEVKCVSGPLKWEISTKYGKRKKVLVPDPNDDHRHDTVYLKSNQLSRPDINVEAAKVMDRVKAPENKQVYDPETGQKLPNLAVR